LEKLQQPDSTLNGNGIREGFVPHVKPQQPVNRVLFREENDGDHEELEIWCQSYQTFLLSLTNRPNNLDPLEIPSSQVLEFEGKARANPI